MLPTIVLHAQHAGILEIADRTEIRARVTEGDANSPGLDVVNAPSARARLADRRWEGTLGYAPILTLRDVQLGANFEALQTGDAGVAWHDRHVRLALTESATYGDQNSSYLLSAPSAPFGPSAPLAPPQLLAPPQTVLFGSSATTLSADLHPGRVWITSSVGYSLSGGLTTASLAVVPFQRGPRAEVSAAYGFTRADAIGVRVTASRAEFVEGPCLAAAVQIAGALAPGQSCAPQIEIGQALGFWRRRLSAASSFSLGAGASEVHTRLRPEDAYAVMTYPIGEAIFERRTAIAEERAQISAIGQIGPAVDPRTGAVDYRAGGTLSVVMPIRRMTLRNLVAATRSIDTQRIEPATLFRIESELDYGVTPYVSVGTGLRYAWQDQAPLGAFSTFVGLVQVTVRAARVRF